jgi:flavin reductase (DIM6/NTAB) family NADH-FMN oxidoreductase RutF
MLDPAAKKSVLRLFTYGLYGVSAAHDGERGIFTANWLSQASFDPPLVMISVEKVSSTLPLIRGSGRFAVSPFAEGQRELAGCLGKPKARAGDKFEACGLIDAVSEGGELVLAEGLGYVVCEVKNEMDAGDSVVILGEVIEARMFDEHEPLTMKSAGFRHSG